MEFRVKKMAVLHSLSQEAEAIELQKLIEKLGDGYAVRSARRWLAQMMEEGLVERIGKKRNTQYRVIQRINRARGTEYIVLPPERPPRKTN